jgi:hypothetical protein
MLSHHGTADESRVDSGTKAAVRKNNERERAGVRRPVHSCSISATLSLLLLLSYTTVVAAWVVPPAARRFNLAVAGRARTMVLAKQKNADTSTDVEAVVSSGLDSDDLSLLMEVISLECRELGVSCTTNDSLPAIVVSAPVESVPGVLGRVLLFRASADMPQDVLEDLEGGICEQMDQLLSEEAISEAVLVSFQTDNDAVPSQQFTATEDNENDNYKQYF